MSRYLMPDPEPLTEPHVTPPDHGPANICAICGATDQPLRWGLCLRDGRYSEGWRCDPACRARRPTPVEKSLRESTPPGPRCTILPGQTGSKAPAEESQEGTPDVDYL